MEEKMEALISLGTWELVEPSRVQVIGAIWMFVVKHNLYDFVVFYKAWLVAKGFTQTYGVDSSTPSPPLHNYLLCGFCFKLHLSLISLFINFMSRMNFSITTRWREFTCNNILALKFNGSVRKCAYWRRPFMDKSRAHRHSSKNCPTFLRT